MLVNQMNSLPRREQRLVRHFSPHPQPRNYQNTNMYSKLFPAIALPNGRNVLTIGLGLYSLYKIYKTKYISSNTVLELDFNKFKVLETEPQGIAASLGLNESDISLISLLETLERAASDPRIVGIVARLSSFLINRNHLFEIREAILRFSSASGKPTVAFVESFVEFGPSLSSYWFATGFSKIFMCPSGAVGLMGPYVNMPFAKHLVEKIGVEPQVIRRREYKSAMELFTEEKCTPANREQLELLYAGLYEEMVHGIAGARMLSEAKVKDIISKGPYSAAEALELGLLDGLHYSVDLYDGGVFQSVFQKKSKLKYLYVVPYWKKIGSQMFSVPKLSRAPYQFALIHAHGAITTGASHNESMGSDTVGFAIHQAADDPRISVIILRVDSPGGSAVASDCMHRELLYAKSKGKKIVVSMGSVAASGGYYISQCADFIVASPFTITGSIGVIFGKMVVAQLAAKLGLTFDKFSINENGRIASAIDKFTAEEKKKVDEMIDVIYEDFKAKAAAGRHLSLEALEQLARGRVYTGRVARENGLVDGIGGLHEAVQHARRLMNVPDDRSVYMRRFPDLGPVLRQLLLPPENSRDDPHTMASAGTSSGVFGYLLSPFAALAIFWRTLTHFNAVMQALQLERISRSIIASDQGVMMLDTTASQVGASEFD